MKYRRLGRSGLKLSEIGLGGWLTFGNVHDERSGREVMDAAFESGVNFFDTANAYAAGECEALWGRLLSAYPRSSYVLATKVYYPMGEGPNDRGLSRKHIMEQCEASLQRLQTDYIDLYQCHRYDDETPLEETVRAMDDLVRQGKVLYWGFSLWSAEAIERLYAPVSSQPHYNMLLRDLEVEVMPACREFGVGHVVFSPLEQGLLTGKYKPGQPLPEGSRAADERQNEFILDRARDQRTLEHIARLQEVADDVGCTLGQLALAWILSRPEITSCIVGATRPEQIRENAGASGIELSEEQLERIDEIIVPVTFSYDYD